MATPHDLEPPEEWVDRYGDTLFRFALARIGDPARAEDLVQETFLAALKPRRNFQQRSSPRTWLTAILKHKIIDHLRKAGREQAWGSEEALDRSIEELFDAAGHWSVRSTPAHSSGAANIRTGGVSTSPWDALTGCRRDDGRQWLLEPFSVAAFGLKLLTDQPNRFVG